MKTRFLATTAISLLLTTAALGQSGGTPSTGSSRPQEQSRTDTSANPSSSTTSQTGPASQTAPNPGTSNNRSTSAQNTPADSRAGGNKSSTTTSQAPAQTSPNSTTSTQQQTANPPSSSSNQAQQTPSSTNAGATQQQQANPAHSTAQSSSTNVNAQVSINDQQRTRINQSVARLDVRPLNSVNFSLTVGTVVPRDIRLSTLPADVVEIVPQYRGYSFVLVKDQIVIVDPATYQVVTVLPYSGTTAAAPSRERKKVTVSNRDRDVVRKHVRSRTEGRTTGSTVRSEIRVGERVPDTIEIETFPDEVYRDSPALREYRYIHRENRTYLIEPEERRIIEEID